MIDILNKFLEQVFDLDDLDPRTFIAENKLKLDIIFAHPKLKINYAFHSLWDMFYGRYAPMTTSHQFMKEFDAPPTFDNMISPMPFSLVRQMLPLYDITRYQQKFNSLLYDSTSLKQFTLRKLCQRWNEPFEQSMLSENILVWFIRMQKNNVGLLENPSKHILMNVKYHINAPPFDKSYENIIRDQHMLRKFINQPCICIDDVHTPNIDILLDIFKKERKRPVILNLSDTFVCHPYKTKAYVFDIHEHRQLIELIPPFFEIFICISSKRYPEIRPLSRDSKRSLYYLYGWSEEDIKNNKPTMVKQLYNRCITSIPYKLQNMPMTTYRIFNPISYHESSPSQTKRVLVGSKSTLGPVSNEGGDAPCRVEVYTPMNKYKHYESVVDTYHEIPMSKMYEYLVHGANVSGLAYSTSPEIARVLFSKELCERMWMEHLQLVCPVTEQSPHNNMLLVHDLILEVSKKCSPACLNKDALNTIVLVDNRSNIYSVLSMLFAISNVDVSKWKAKLFTSKSCIAFYKDFLAKFGVEVLEYHLLETEIFDIDTYNATLKDADFWKTIGGDKVLIIQDDGMLLRPGVERYLTYDYVGAPWVDAPPNAYLKKEINKQLVGNGGLSLRDVAKCIHITETFVDEKMSLFYDNQVEIPEDVYFVSAMIKCGYNVANFDEASKFSSEQVLNLSSLGFHKPWCYNPREHMEMFFASMKSI